MATIRNVNEIILSLLDFFRLAQPDLDTKAGTVARDLFVEAPAAQLALLYEELSNISNKQSLRVVVGNDLDQLAKNFSITRRSSTKASGVAVLTFSSITAPINIDKGDLVIATNGFSFAVINGISVSSTDTNFYRSIATKYRDQLDAIGISDEYAVEVSVTATSAGSGGNLGSYSLTRTTIADVSNVTNIESFSGGTDQEDDITFRNRVLSSFTGSSVGTSLGYLNAALGTTGVQDAQVIEPGDTLMTRDGTDVEVATDGTRTIVSEGSGGKVDVVVLGSSLTENTESYIFIDKSNSNDPTSSKNDVVLGQISGDENKTINRKRIDNIASGVLPKQPVDSLVQVTGSLSGSNFIEKTTDSFGRVSGNYELVKDDGVYGGGPWGFDTFSWVSNKISLFSEDVVKGQFNGQDNVSFTDVLAIPDLQQLVSITNENSTVTSDRSYIQLLHYPVTNVTRVFNVNTGERYVIKNQNPDQTGTYNTTGRVNISGNTLPTPSDVLQVDYSWVVDYDRYSDYDGLEYTSNSRSVTDSIDWGYASLIKNEKVWFTKNTSTNFYEGTSSHPISSVISAYKYNELDGYVSTITSGSFVERLAVIVQNLEAETTSVDSVTLKNNNSEIYNTDAGDSSFYNETTVVGIEVLYNTYIILPTDTPVSNGDWTTVRLNGTDVFTSSSTNGSFSNRSLTIPASLVNTTADSIAIELSYIANVSTMFSSATTSLPTSRSGNGFKLSSNVGAPNFSVANITRRENQTVQLNLSAQYYLELSISNTDVTLTADDVVSVIRLSDGLELWNVDNPGTVTTAGSGTYQLILSGLNTPATNDSCLVIYQATDIRRFQPFSFSNTIIDMRVDELTQDPSTRRMVVPLNSFTTQASGLAFKILEPNTDTVLFNVTDGYITASTSTAIIGSATVDFSSQNDLVYKKLKIIGATDPNNDGVYDITEYNPITNKITITSVLDNITADQISVIALKDSQEIWDYNGSIQVSNNRLLLAENSSISLGDKVVTMFFNFKNLRKGQTKVAGSIVDQTVNTGVITVYGKTIHKAEDVIFTATSSGLQLNLAEALRDDLGLSSSASIPSNINLVKLIKLEKVVTASSNSDEVLSVSATYDVKNTTIADNILYSDEMLQDTTLQSTEFVLPSTENNTFDLDTQNLPALGDKMRVTFYYTKDDDSENLSYTRNGLLYTNNKFVFFDRVYISSGFASSQSARFGITSFTQPSLGSRYKVYYDYTAPKSNERITIKYNYNSLITSVTFNIENTRPINADVLAREAKLISLDLTMNVVINPTYSSSKETILQTLRSELTTALTATELGTTVDSISLINIAQGITGISRARILYFNETGETGQVLTITAQKDEYFAPNTITLATETR